MAKTISRFRILAKSDRMGKKDKAEQDKMIRYAGVLSFDKIDLTTPAKELSWGEYWTTDDLVISTQEDYFAEVEVGKDPNTYLRVTRVMTRKQFLESL